MNSRFKQISPEPFIISTEHVDKVYDLFSEYFEEVTFAAQCKDNTSRIFESKEEFFSYENIDTSRISTIYIEGKKSKEQVCIDSMDIAWIENNTSDEAACHINITADDQTMKNIRDQLGKVVITTVPWYRRIAKINSALVSKSLYTLWWMLTAGVFVHLIYEIVSQDTTNKAILHIIESIPENKAVFVIIAFLAILIMSATFFEEGGQPYFLRAKEIVFPNGRLSYRGRKTKA